MITSRKTQQEVRMQLDKLDLELLRRVIREELEAHERRKEQPDPRYYGGYVTPCWCGQRNYCSNNPHCPRVRA